MKEKKILIAGLLTIVSIEKLLYGIENRVIIRKIFLSRSQQISSSITDPFLSRFPNDDYSSDFQSEAISCFSVTRLCFATLIHTYTEEYC